jgi:hypothetical protein
LPGIHFIHYGDFIMELKKLNTLIGSISRGATKQRVDIQDALIGCAEFVYKDRNLDPLIRLLAAIGKGVNRRAVGKWASLNMPVHFKDEKPQISDKRHAETVNTYDLTDYLILTAEQAPWFDMDGSNKAENVWDTSIEMAKVEKYIADEVKKARTNGDEIFADYMDKILLSVKDTFIKARAESEVVETE